MKHCKTCKHWHNPFGDDEPWGDCQFITSDNPRAKAEMIVEVDPIWSTSTIHVALTTHESFGCVNHESKQDT